MAETLMLRPAEKKKKGKKSHAVLPAQRLSPSLLHCEVVRTIFSLLPFVKNVLTTGLPEHGRFLMDMGINWHPNERSN